MRIVHQKREIEQKVALLKKAQKTIGFVPTMGALHDGHMALVKKALHENNVVVVSIFVNPTQFNNADDLQKYPRTLADDVKLLEKTSSEIIVFAPEPNELYGKEIVATAYDFGGLEIEMEGKYRSGHFDGVGTVLKHFFSIITPTNAYFGEKDFQQLQIVRKMVAIENMAVTIIGCPIFREESGLALSSRNSRLTKAQKEVAPMIYKILKQVFADFGIKSVQDIKEDVISRIAAIPLLELEYFEIVDAATLSKSTKKENSTKYRAFIAVYAGEVRLIDNIALN